MSSNKYSRLATEQPDDTLAEEIQKAHVVCVVYSVECDESLDRITAHWLPVIRECSGEQRKPVVLVGNKIDLIDYSTIDVSVKYAYQQISETLRRLVKSVFAETGTYENVYQSSITHRI